MIEIGNLVTLTDNKEYIVANILELHSIKYAYLVSSEKPLEILIATMKDVAGTIVLEEIKDTNELDYILNQFALNTVSE